MGYFRKGTLAARTDEKGPTLESIVFRSEQIKRLLKKLKSKTSSGPDGLPPIVFKNLANYLARPLAKLYNLLMLKEIVPNL